jgi:PBP1b-binding outer membrane lipoprotein LpoB
MRKSLLLLAAGVAILAGCSKNNSSQPAPATNSVAASTNHGSSVTAPAGYLGTVMQADKSMTQKIDVTYLNEAIQQFNVQEGRYPTNLLELVPNYVAKIPAAPHGSQIIYDATNGTVKVVAQQ